MRSVIPNPPPPTKTSFLYRFLATRRRMRELINWSSDVNNFNNQDPSRPDVSVMLITYNHKKYISQALDSILQQKGNFTFEINIIDDASNDGTQDIILEYKKKYPDIINCYFNQKNIGHIATQLNAFRGFQTLRGKYFAILEGDDYWTDINKLAKQIDFLDNNLNFVACAHWTFKFFDDTHSSPEHFLPFLSNLHRTEADINSLIRMDMVFHLSSILYRNVFESNPPVCLSDEYSCEATINMTYGLFGKFYCFKEYMSAYRVHSSGVFSGRSREAIWMFHLHGFRRFALYLGVKHWNTFSYAIFHFSRWVLRAPSRGDEVTSLSSRTQWVFRLHLLGAFLGYLLTFPFENIKHMRKIFSREFLSRVKRKLQSKFATWRP